MAYRFQVNQQTCISCGICMDLCPVRCLDMTRPAGNGTLAAADEQLSPIPGEQALRPWMPLSPSHWTPTGTPFTESMCPSGLLSR